jgi:hypothetical protein
VPASPQSTSRAAEPGVCKGRSRHVRHNECNLLDDRQPPCVSLPDPRLYTGSSCSQSNKPGALAMEAACCGASEDFALPDGVRAGKSTRTAVPVPRAAEAQQSLGYTRL